MMFIWIVHNENKFYEIYITQGPQTLKFSRIYILTQRDIKIVVC